MSESKGLAGKGMLGCGALLLLACTAGCLFFGFHVFLDPHGRISDDEALPGLLAAVFCGMTSLALAAVGAFLMMQKPAVGSSAPGAPALPHASAPASTKVDKPFPTHLVAGCLSLVMVALSCGAFGGAAYFYDRVSGAEMLERFAREDQMRDGRSYGLGPDYWRRQAEERRQYALGSLCCGGSFLLLFFLGLVGAAVLYRRNQATIAQRLAASSAGPDPATAAGGFTPPPPGT